MTGASPPYPHLLSFTGKKVRQRKRTVAAAYARLDRRFFKKSFAKRVCMVRLLRAAALDRGFAPVPPQSASGCLFCRCFLGCVWFGSYGLPPFMGALPPYPRSLPAVGCFAGVWGTQSASGCLQTKRANHSLIAYGCFSPRGCERARPHVNELLHDKSKSRSDKSREDERRSSNKPSER